MSARGRSRTRPAWPYALATVALFLGFLAVWALAGLVFGLGTCGEDSDISAADYERLCASGRISRNLVIVALAAAIVTAGLGAAAIRRRAPRPVLVLTALLTLAGAASLAADRL
jgi:hypothetical protein